MAFPRRPPPQFPLITSFVHIHFVLCLEDPSNSLFQFSPACLPACLPAVSADSKKWKRRQRRPSLLLLQHFLHETQASGWLTEMLIKRHGLFAFYHRATKDMRDNLLITRRRLAVVACTINMLRNRRRRFQRT